MRKILNLREKVFGGLKFRRGNAILASIVVSAIILIALVLLNTPIKTFINDMWLGFSNFVDGKLTTLFGS
ncbi:MAG: hypothetical protein WCZ27_09705 [Tissierellaceae bacterium]